MIPRVSAILVAMLLAPGALWAAEPVRVLAAFTLKPALDAIGETYRGGGAAVTLVYGPSPTLAEQVENGLAADLFFSADPAWTEELAKHRLIRPDSLTELLSNDLVLVARKGTAKPVSIGRDTDIAALIGKGPVAMCDPGGHPAGRMARASLTTLGQWTKVQKKVAIAENPLAAVALVAKGGAPFAIVFRTDALTDPDVETVGTFPPESHPSIRYPVAILAKSANPDAAKFLLYLKSAAARDIFKRFGYTTLGTP
ncbi:MAG TPA: molybdate ABC transporter substrate-binding protein [Stellaceae bacterium]|nr:molybdate ABC transporter substrate-binding protein [Stellaceae bacterium]